MPGPYLRIMAPRFYPHFGAPASTSVIFTHFRTCLFTNQFVSLRESVEGFMYSGDGMAERTDPRGLLLRMMCPSLPHPMHLTIDLRAH